MNDERDLVDLVKEHRENDPVQETAREYFSTHCSYCGRHKQLENKTKGCPRCYPDEAGDEAYQRSKDDQAISDLVGF